MRPLQYLLFVLWILMFPMSDCVGNTDPKLYYKVAGTGETILFIHGSQEDYRIFMPQLEILKESHQTVTYSRRYNHPNGNHYDGSTSYSVYTEADDLLSLLDELGEDSLHLVGHSYGGLIAMAFANRHPERVKSLILSEPPLLRLPGCEKWHEHAQRELIEKGKNTWATSDSSAVMSVIFEFFAGADIQDQVPPHVLEMLYANLEEMVALFHSDEPFPALNVDPEKPILFITSGNTLPLLECTNEVFLQQNPGARHLHLPEATHDMWVSHPEALSQAVLEFVSGDF